MDRSYPYTRRLIQRTRLQRRVALALAASVAACVVLYSSVKPMRDADPLQDAAVPALLASNTAAPAAAASSSRRVYPYSIVPGGVSGAAELARVIRTDKVVAAHYAEFDVDKAREATVTKPRAVHVSYRKGDKVYWTAKKVMLAEGETLLSDGSHEMRARCANRISDTPQLPVEAHGPSAEELDSSVSQDVAGAGNMENVAMAMLDDAAGGGRAGGFLDAPGSGGTGGALGGDPAGGGDSALASTFGAAPGMGAVSNGGTLGGKASSSSGTRPVPGTTTPDGSSTSPTPTLPGGAGNPVAPGTPTGSSPAVPGDSAPPPQPDATLPSTTQPPASGATPGAGVPGTTPGAGVPGTTPGAALPGSPSPGLPGSDPVPNPGNQAGGGGSAELPPATQPPTGGTTPPTGGTTPSTGGAPGELPITEPVVKPPVQPAKPEDNTALPTPIPEPGTLTLVGAALIAMLARRRRRGALR